MAAKGPASTISPGWGLHPGSISLCRYAEKTSALKTDDNIKRKKL